MSLGFKFDMCFLPPTMPNAHSLRFPLHLHHQMHRRRNLLSQTLRPAVKAKAVAAGGVIGFLG